MTEEHLQPFGFKFGKNGAHPSRTIMLDEIVRLFEHNDTNTCKETYLSDIIDYNLLDKGTYKSRQLTARHLIAPYSLDNQVPLFRIFRKLWSIDPAALEKKLLKAIIEGEAPLDIFVRWKPESEQPIGWNPDLNDGVRLNIRPFLLCGEVGKKGAGILRTKPNIHWKKDRGKDVPSTPWSEKFGGDRINDHHLTLAEKNAAQQ